MTALNYTAGTVSLTNGSAVVTGVDTAWQIALIVGGTIYVEAAGNPLPIDSVDSDTQITAAIAWAGATGTYNYVLRRSTTYDEQVAKNAEIFARLVAELEAGTIWKYDASGDTAGRAFYDTRPKGFSYLDVSGEQPALWIKASNDEADWAGPFSYGVGPVGPAPSLTFSPVVTGEPGTPASVDVTGSGPYDLTFTVPAGVTGVRWRGAYDAGTSYLEHDGVRDNGSTWIALQDSIGNAPPVLPTTANAFWELVAAKGLDGTGTGDVVGPAGAIDGRPAVFDGTTGKLLKQGDSVERRTVFVTKSGAYTAVANDNNAFYEFTAAAMLTLTAAATLGADWHMMVFANGGDVTIDADGTELINGEETLVVADGDAAYLICTGSAFKAVTIRSAEKASKGHIYGLTLSNNASDATNDIDIAAGEAADDSATPWCMVLAAALTKRLDAAWAVGSGNGGLDTGSIANGTYHVWLIQRSDTGVVDVLFSTSATSPTMPTNYDRKRRIGSIIREGGAIVLFSQNGDEFLRKSPILSVNATNPGTDAVPRTLNVPTGVQVVSIAQYLARATATTQAGYYVSSPDQDDQAPSIVSGAPLTDFGLVASAPGQLEAHVIRLNVRTNTSAQIRTRHGSSDASVNIQIVTLGWIDARGRN